MQDRYNNRIRRVDIATGATTTLAGSGTRGFLDGAGDSAQFNLPSGFAIDPSGGYALVGVRGSCLDSLHPLDSPQPAIPQTAHML